MQFVSISYPLSSCCVRPPVHRKEGGDSESGELHVEVSRGDERHHASRRAPTGPGALKQAAHCQVRGTRSDPV